MSKKQEEIQAVASFAIFPVRNDDPILGGMVTSFCLPREFVRFVVLSYIGEVLVVFGFRATGRNYEIG